MKYSISALVLGFCAVLSAAAPTPDGDDIDPKEVYIETANYGGTGCKAGTASVVKSDDAKIVTLTFDEYYASIGPKVPIPETRKNCNLQIKVHYPPGYQYTIYTTDYSGYTKLDKDIEATQQSDYWFAGFVAQKATLKSVWYGELDKNFAFTDTLAHDAYVWSPCGASTVLNINTQMKLNNNKNKGGSGYISTDVIDHKVKTVHKCGIQWRKCK